MNATPPHSPHSIRTDGDDDSKDPSEDQIDELAEYGLRQWTGWLLGPGLLLCTLLLSPPTGLSEPGWRTAGVAALMATFWMCETIPIPATALLPLVLFPLLGISDMREAAAPYANPLIFLFLGGFIIALAMQKWGLHRRVAMRIIGCVGSRPKRIVLGFLLAAALVSMWVSNTATALMMLPIALSVIQMIPVDRQDMARLRQFQVALLLAVAYGATTGGMATLIGTPPNALLAGYMSEVYNLEIGFLQWMLIGIPATVIALPLVYWVLTRIVFRIGGEPITGLDELLAAERTKLGRMSRGETAVAIVFGLTVIGWLFRPLIDRALPLISDTSIAMIAAVALFMIPIHPRQGEFAMDWEATKKLPWGVLLLFGGGLSLAASIDAHGLSRYLGELTADLAGFPLIVILAILAFGILMLTELTSNTATAATFLPVVAAIAIGMGEGPLLFVIPTVLAANCAYMMPVGTPPNAIVFGSGMIRLPDMARAGLLLNLILVPVILTVVWFLGPFVFDLQPGMLPDWATPASR